MKLIILKPLAYALMLFFLTTLLGSCSEDAELSAEEKAKKLLTSNTWQPTSTGEAITLDGIDVQDELFAGFTLKFTEDRILTTGTSPVWLREDTWHFKPGSNAGIIVRGMDDKEIIITTLLPSQLTITLNWDQTTYGGRALSLPGTYTFLLTQ